MKIFNHTVQGFTILELIMVIAASAFIMTTVLMIYNQVSRNMNRVERFVFEDTQLLTLENRLQKDFAGLSSIWFTHEQVQALQQKKLEKTEKIQDDRKANDCFYSINKNGMLDTLTFLTTTGLCTYGNANQSKFVRVVYKLQEDQKNQNSFQLMRKEIMTPCEFIDEKSLQEGNFYELVRGIKSLEMTYDLVDMSELKKKQDVKKKDSNLEDKDQKKPMIRSVKQWVKTSDKKNKKNGDISSVQQDKESDDQKQNEEQENLGGAIAPKFIHMKIVFQATDFAPQREYRLDFAILNNVDNIPKSIFAIKKQAEKNLKENSENEDRQNINTSSTM
ncbi:MAG: PulJ/GspJ family protein [Candidatus Chromulinivorax sp.]